MLGGTWVRLMVAMLVLGTFWGSEAQTNLGNLTGEVHDQSGAVIPGVQVVITNVATGTTNTIVTTGAGLFTASSLPPGAYQIDFTRAGFQHLKVDDVSVATATTTTQNVVLRPGGVEMTVEVEASSPLLQGDSAQLTNTIEQKTIEELPLIEQSTLGLALLTPGVTGDPQYANGVQSENANPFTAAITPGVSISINGGRTGSTAILVDGSDNALSSYARTGVTFSRNTIQEITVQQSGQPAQYGRDGGGIINQSTRSGGTQYHGFFDWRHVDPSTEAGTYGLGFPRAKHQNILAAGASGPVPLPFVSESWKHTRPLFFFADYEPLRADDVVYQRTRVPTPAEIAGDFTNSLEITSTGTKSIYNQFTGPAGCPATILPCGPKYASTSQYQPIGLNLSSYLAANPTAQKLLAFYPTPSNPGKAASFLYPNGALSTTDNNNIISFRSAFNKDDRWSVRLDQVATPRDTITARYTRVPIRGVRNNLFGQYSPANTIPTDAVTAQNMILEETHVFSGRLTNTIREAYTRVREYRSPSPVALSEDWGAAVGLKPAIQGVGFPTIGSLPTVGLGSGGNINTPGGLELDTNLGFSDDVGWVLGRHSLHIGTDIRWLHLNRADPSYTYGGEYDFSAGDSNNGSGGSALASFELGIINKYIVKTVVRTFRYRWRYYAGYVQDDFRVNSRLTLNLGLRYNVETPRYEVNNQQGSFLPGTAGAANGIPVTGGFVFAGSNGRSRYLFPINYSGVEPRLGVSYAVTPRVVLHSSYALIHAPLNGIGAPIVPDLTTPNQNFSNGGGGQNSAWWANYVTNPIGSIAPPIQQTSGALFSTPNGSAAIPYIDQRNVVPYVQLYGGSLQFQVMRSAALYVSYAGSNAHHLFTPPINTNVPSLSVLQNAIQAHQQLGTSNIPNAYGLGNENGLQALRPYQNFAFDVLNSAYDRYGASDYNALLVNFRQRITRGLLVQAGYSWQKSLDNASSGYTDGNSEDIYGLFSPQTPYTYQGEWSLSTYDVPTRLTVGYSYTLPFGTSGGFRSSHAWVNKLIGGWSNSSVASLQDGYPLAISLGSNGYWFSTTYTCGPTGTGTGTSRCANGNGGTAIQGAVLRPNRVPGVDPINHNWRSDPFGISTGKGLINVAAFAPPGSLDNPGFGNLPRTDGAIRNPYSAFFDTSLRKTTVIHDRQTLMIAVNAINALNHTNFFVASKNIFGSYSSSLTSASTGCGSPKNLCFIDNSSGAGVGGFAAASSVVGGMGQTSQTAGREIQFEVRYSF